MVDSSSDDEELLSERAARLASMAKLEERVRLLEESLAQEKAMLRELAVWSAMNAWPEESPMTVNAIAARLEPLLGETDRAWLRATVKTYAEATTEPPAAAPPKPSTRKKKK